MTRDDIQKLLGGYATGTLTPEEQRILFEAALEDQELFDAMAREEALREVLSDPAARAHLLAATEVVPVPWYRRWTGFWPRAIPVAALVAIVVMVGITFRQEHPPETTQVAKVETPRPPVVLPKSEVSAVQPVLPPPPEVARTRQASAAPYRPLPGTTPMAAPPPPPAAGPQQRAALDNVAPMPMLQQAQQQGAPVLERFTNNNAPAIAANTASPANNFVQGVVTDAAGAAISSATVELKSAITGQVTATSTNSRGEFRAAEMPGTQYEVKASAPGFKTTTANVTTPPNGQPAQQNLRLDVAPTTETVEVGAASFLKDSRPATASRDDIVSLNGLVTDSSGSVIPRATVDLKSLTTGKETRTTTDERGRFNLPETPKGAYEITTSKQGFQTKTEVTTATAEQVNVKLDSASADAFSSTSARKAAPAGVVGGIAAGRGGRGGTGVDTMSKAKTATLAAVKLEFHVLRRVRGAELQELAPNATIPAGSDLILRVNPQADGEFLVDRGTGQPLLNASLKKGVLFEKRLPELPLGRVELRIYFANAPAGTFVLNMR